MKTPNSKRVKPERSEAGGEKTKVISGYTLDKVDALCLRDFLFVNFEENKGGWLVYMILE